MLSDLVGRVRSTRCTITRRAIRHRPFWHGQLTPFYSDIGRLSIDPELNEGLPFRCRPVSIKPRNNLGVALFLGPSLQRAASHQAFARRFLIS
jgi:hypothetical protein